MDFGQAIAAGFSNYVNFSDRACRSEYWFWTLFVFLADIATWIVDTAVGVQVTSSLFNLAVLLPGIAIGVRRLHDLDRTGWWLLIVFIPLIGWIVLLIWYCSKGTEGPSRFGPDRLATLGAQISPRPAT